CAAGNSMSVASKRGMNKACEVFRQILDRVPEHPENRKSRRSIRTMGKRRFVRDAHRLVARVESRVVINERNNTPCRSIVVRKKDGCRRLFEPLLIARREVTEKVNRGSPKAEQALIVISNYHESARAGGSKLEVHLLL